MCSISEPHNKYPDCLDMQLEGRHQQDATLVEQIDLHLTLRFDEHRRQLDSDFVTFSLKRGKLRLNLRQGIGSIHHGSCELNGLTFCRLTQGGSDEDLTWVFEANEDDPALIGTLQGKLGTLSVAGKPCYADVTFGVPRPQDVYIGGPWSARIDHNRYINKSPVIQTLILRRLGFGMESYLSYVELQCE